MQRLRSAHGSGIGPEGHREPASEPRPIAAGFRPGQLGRSGCNTLTRPTARVSATLLSNHSFKPMPLRGTA